MKLIYSGIFLLLVGLICAFAWNPKIPHLDVDALGYILIGVGILSIILGLVLRRRPTSAVTTTTEETGPPENTTIRY